MQVKSSHSISYRDPDVNGVDCIAFVHSSPQNFADVPVITFCLREERKLLASPDLTCLHDLNG